MKKLFLFLLLWINFAIAHEDNFNYQNQAVNPACIAMFNSSIADFPYIKSINLSVCQDSNAAYKKTYHTDDDWYYFYNNDKNDQEGEYRYKVMGKTDNGIYVLHTQSSGGGTLVASDLLLIRLGKNKEFTYDRSNGSRISEITQLTLLGYVIGGDRCVGDFAKVNVEGHILKIQQHNGSNPVDCDKIKNYTIDLSKLNKL